LIIVTLVRNDLDGLTTTLSSILSQPLQDVVSKILIVDGVSEDGSDIYAKSVAITCPSVELLSRPPIGIYDAMNGAIEHLLHEEGNAGEAVLFLNSGDFLMSGDGLSGLNKMVADNHWATGLASLISYRNFPNFETPKLSYYGVKKPNPHEYWIPHQALATKLSSLESIGLFNLDYKIAADYDLMGRFWEKFGPPKGLNEVVVCQVLVGLSNVKTYSGHAEKNIIAIKSGFTALSLPKITKFKWWLKEFLYLRFPKINPEIRSKVRVSKALAMSDCHPNFDAGCPWCKYSILSSNGKLYDWVSA